MKNNKPLEWFGTLDFVTKSEKTLRFGVGTFKRVDASRWYISSMYNSFNRSQLKIKFQHNWNDKSLRFDYQLRQFVISFRTHVPNIHKVIHTKCKQQHHEKCFFFYKFFLLQNTELNNLIDKSIVCMYVFFLIFFLCCKPNKRSFRILFISILFCSFSCDLKSVLWSTAKHSD